MQFPFALGAYVLARPLAKGGMAEVFLGHHRDRPHDTLCIKLMLPRFVTDAAKSAMFRDEARLALALSHPKIVRVFDFGAVDETLFIAMEFVPGGSVGQRMQLGPLPVRASLAVAIDIAEALCAVHSHKDAAGRAQSVVHRDVTPQNLLIASDGITKLSDFGVARSALMREVRTASGIVKGKPAYIAPEAYHGRRTDHRADQYALGVVLWEMLAGKRLFRGSDEMAVMRAVMFDPVPALRVDSTASGALSALVKKATARSPDDRYADTEQFLRALAAIEPREPNGRAWLATDATAQSPAVTSTHDDVFADDADIEDYETIRAVTASRAHSPQVRHDQVTVRATPGQIPVEAPRVTVRVAAPRPSVTTQPPDIATVASNRAKPARPDDDTPSANVNAAAADSETPQWRAPPLSVVPPQSAPLSPFRQPSEVHRGLPQAANASQSIALGRVAIVVLALVVGFAAGFISQRSVRPTTPACAPLGDGSDVIESFEAIVTARRALDAGRVTDAVALAKRAVALHGSAEAYAISADASVAAGDGVTAAHAWSCVFAIAPSSDAARNAQSAIAGHRDR